MPAARFLYILYLMNSAAPCLAITDGRTNSRSHPEHVERCFRIQEISAAGGDRKRFGGARNGEHKRGIHLTCLPGGSKYSLCGARTLRLPAKPESDKVGNGEGICPRRRDRGKKMGVIRAVLSNVHLRRAVCVGYAARLRGINVECKQPAARHRCRRQRKRAQRLRLPSRSRRPRCPCSSRNARRPRSARSSCDAGCPGRPSCTYSPCYTGCARRTR